MPYQSNFTAFLPGFAIICFALATFFAVRFFRHRRLRRAAEVAVEKAASADLVPLKGMIDVLECLMNGLIGSVRETSEVAISWEETVPLLCSGRLLDAVNVISKGVVDGHKKHLIRAVYRSALAVKNGEAEAIKAKHPFVIEDFPPIEPNPLLCLKEYVRPATKA
jgi:hypothetical protein